VGGTKKWAPDAICICRFSRGRIVAALTHHPPDDPPFLPGISKVSKLKIPRRNRTTFGTLAWKWIELIESAVFFSAIISIKCAAEYFKKKSKLKSEIRSIFFKKINFCDWSAAVANQRRVAVFLADTVTFVFIGNTHGAIYHRYPVAGIESAAE
jgi:hypothetical protein